MKLNEYLKNEVEELSDGTILEAAEVNESSKQPIAVRGTRIHSFKNVLTTAACAVLVVAIAVAALILPGISPADTTPGDAVDFESENETTQDEEYVPKIDLSIIPDEVYDSLQFAIIGSDYPKTSEDGEFWYIIRDGKAVISRYLGDKTEVTIPTEVDGIPVSMVQGYAELLTYPSITEDDGYTDSGKQRLHGCFRYTNVKKVTVPGSVKVGENAFLCCNELETVILEEGIKEIDIAAFRRCVKLTSVTLSEGLQSIHPLAFDGCESLTEITFPASVLDVGTYSFANCTSLEKVTFLSDNHVIAKNAFEGTPYASPIVQNEVPEIFSVSDVDLSSVTAAKIYNLVTGEIARLTEADDISAICDVSAPLSGTDPKSSRGYYGEQYGCCLYEVELYESTKSAPILNYILCEVDESEYYVLSTDIYETMGETNNYRAMYVTDKDVFKEIEKVCDEFFK